MHSALNARQNPFPRNADRRPAWRSWASADGRNTAGPAQSEIGDGARQPVLSIDNDDPLALRSKVFDELACIAGQSGIDGETGRPGDGDAVRSLAWNPDHPDPDVHHRFDCAILEGAVGRARTAAPSGVRRRLVVDGARREGEAVLDAGIDFDLVGRVPSAALAQRLDLLERHPTIGLGAGEVELGLGLARGEVRAVGLIGDQPHAVDRSRGGDVVGKVRGGVDRRIGRSCNSRRRPIAPVAAALSSGDRRQGRRCRP